MSLITLQVKTKHMYLYYIVFAPVTWHLVPISFENCYMFVNLLGNWMLPLQKMSFDVKGINYKLSCQICILKAKTKTLNN